MRSVRQQLSHWNFSRVAIIKIILLIVNTVPHVLHCCYCFKGKRCSCFECLLSCDSLKTVIHYHQKPYVPSVTGLHRSRISSILSAISKNSCEPRHDKTCLWEFPTRPDTNRPAQPQKLARVLKFWLKNLEINVILSKQRTTKTLMRLCGCAGWSAPLMFAYDIRHIFSWPAHVYMDGTRSSDPPKHSPCKTDGELDLGLHYVPRLVCPKT